MPRIDHVAVESPDPLDHEIAVGLFFEDLDGRQLEAITYGDGVT